MTFWNKNDIKPNESIYVLADESALIRAAEMGEGQASHPQPPAPSQDDDATQDPNSDETLEPATQGRDVTRRTT